MKKRSFSLVVRLVECVASAFLVVASALAEGPITARTEDLPLDSPYVTVNLNPVANDALAFAFPSNRVQVNPAKIPFELVNKAGATHLFLKPIGWSAATNETGAEYPSYYALYDTRTANTNNLARAIVPVPVADYSAAWLLATADPDPALTNVVTLRLGVIDGSSRVVYHDFVAAVPRADEKNPAGVAKTITTPGGNLYLIRVPMGLSIAQDFKGRRWLDLDITKELRTAINLPDPHRFQVRPLGVPSGVRIFGLTLERNWVQMEVTGAEPGNVFNEPQAPTFRLDFMNVGNKHYVAHKIQSIARCDSGTVTTNVEAKPYVPWGGLMQDKRVITIPVTERGQYDLTINLVDPWDNIVASRHTTFALLARDTRKYRGESPFGTWDFHGAHGTPNDMDLLGTLAVKAGMRYLADDPKYGLADYRAMNVASSEVLDPLLKRKAEDPAFVPPKRLLIFHENGISGDHVTRTPDLFTGRPPYKLNDAEHSAFTNLWRMAEGAFRAARPAFPDAEIYFGNCSPLLVEEFLRQKFPRELLDKAGNESGNFMRLPETQPLDWIANNAGLWMFRQVLDYYGYKDVGLRQCFEICYPGTNPGNLTERTQAAYIVRHMMHSLAWRIPVITPMCITDMGSTYYFSNWGAAGFCHAWPDVCPKPSYVAFAVMTLLLDGATFVRHVPVKSTVVYAVEFKRKDQSVVTCLWTPRGSRVLTVEAPGARKQPLTDMMGRESSLAFKDGQAELVISREPCYLVTSKPLKSIALGAIRHEDGPGTNVFRVAALGKLSDWTVEPGRSTELETYNFLNPRRKGNFEYREAGAFEGETDTLEVKPKLPCEGSSYLQMYSVLALNKPVELPGRPTEIGVWVNGNGGWGRVIFELQDAAGQRWISIGAEQGGTPNQWMADWLSKEEFAKLNQKSMNLSDWNSDDAWGRSVINHEGWRFVRFPMPGQYPGEGYHWPKNSQWRWSGDGVVHYPLKFTKLVITMPEKVLYLTQYIPPPRYEIYLKDLMAIYNPVEKVFAGE